MRVRLGLLGLALAAGLGASVAGASVSARGPAAARLQAFDGCPSFLAYVRKQALPLVGPWGLGGVVEIAAGAPGAARDAVAGAPGGEPEHSATNVQEEGVDEPDLVKTDGRTLFVATDGRVSALDVRGGGRPKLVDTLRFDRGADELLLERGHLLVLSRGVAGPIPIDGDRDPRAVPVSRENRRRGRRRPRPSAPARRPHARARRQLPRRATRRRHGAARARLAARSRPARSSSPAPQVPRRRRRRDAEEPRRRPHVRRAALAARVHAARSSRQGRAEAAARPVPPGVAAARVRRARPRDRADVRRRERARRGRRGRDRLGRARRLREPLEPLRRDRPLRRAPGRGPAGAGRGDHHDPSLRHLEPDAEPLSRQRKRPRRAARPVVALGAGRGAPRRQHVGADLVGRARDRERDVGDAPSPCATTGSPGSGASAGSAGASGSTPCGSSAMPATSSRSARSTRSTCSTSRRRRARGSAAS